MRITRPQIQKIYATARELNIDNELLHTYVFNKTGSEHISTLTVAEACKVIDGLEAHKIEKTGGHAPGRATPKQKKFIEDLEKKLGWHEEPQRMKGYIKKYAGVEDISWLTQKQASNIIEGLKKVVEREGGKRSEAWKETHTKTEAADKRFEAQSR